MNRRQAASAVALSIALMAGLWSAGEGQGRPGQPVSGVVINRAGAPVGGLEVQLIHTQIGPSFPTTTNPSGRYYFPSVPTNVSTPYIIEVRWGRDVIYRDYLRHLGQQEPIRLR